MPRSLSSYLVAETTNVVTTPFFLLRIDWDGGVSHLSTGGTVAYDGEIWTGERASLSELRSLPGGGLTGEIRLLNTDDAIGAALLSQDMSDVPVTIWALYGSTWTGADAEQVFAGVLDGATIGATECVLGIVSEGRRRQRAPRLYCAPPLCNHLPPRGSIIVWGGERYELIGA